MDYALNSLRHATGTAVPSRAWVESAGFLDTLALFTNVLLPTISKGVILRRPRVLALAEFLDLDRRAVRRMQRVRDRRGAGPLLLSIPGRNIAMLFDPGDVARVLEASPEPFATETTEKRAALAHFQPKGVLISHGEERAERRRVNEEVLESHTAVHAFAGRFLHVIAQEAEQIRRRGHLDWSSFADAWFRVVRRVIFGDIATNDDRLSVVTARLRARSNWAFLAPQLPELRDELLQRIRNYIANAEPGSLAGLIAHMNTSAIGAPEHQVPQWLFAFDAAGMATFRALALLATHPDQCRQARDEVRDGGTRAEMPYLRSVMLESVRLWPTTPLLLRQTTAPTEWRNGVLPADTLIVTFVPFFHRDDTRVAWADAFTPELWTNPALAQGQPLIPFSEGPAFCPGRNLVLMLGSAMLSEVLQFDAVTLVKPAGRLGPNRPLPGTLNHYGLRFSLH